jgi:hypothetical protein
VSDERKEHAATAQGYNGRDAVRLLRASVDATDDRDELRVIDSQLRQLLARIRDKMTGRRRPR